ncbi:hypothetical protein EYC80_001761 [Monilinia laxa]|uniref:Uncharacterized protein n=1 Tax=Monilinia laxa TaxID=61186 RepID=A0A5N6K622_MONLA|nr:hypothetical protein EYC80_001761 [Monilinia laxa]
MHKEINNGPFNAVNTNSNHNVDNQNTSDTCCKDPQPAQRQNLRMVPVMTPPLHPQQSHPIVSPSARPQVMPPLSDDGYSPTLSSITSSTLPRKLIWVLPQSRD